MDKKQNLHEDISYHSDKLNVPLDTSIIPELTNMLFKAISAERLVLVKAVAGLKSEVDHYKNILLTDQELSFKIGMKPQ